MSVYLDHAATSPMSDEVFRVYADALHVIGNPSSIHTPGQHAREMLESGREQLARSIGADPVEVVFTGGGTEAVNLGIKGLFWAREPRKRIVVPRGEHHATLDSVQWLVAHQGAKIVWVDLEQDGRIRLDMFAEILHGNQDDIALATALWVNNEVGTIQPVAEIVALCERYEIPVHLDAVAALGQIDIDAHAVRADTISLSAHKIGGPVGVGALVLSRTAKVEALLHGGSQQRARSGTQDAAGAVAFGVAASRAVEELPLTRIAKLRDEIVREVLAIAPGASLRGVRGEDRVPGNAHFTFSGADGDALLYLLDAAGIAISTGSACTAGIPEPSHVLQAMGLSEVESRGAIRVSLGHTTTRADVQNFLDVLPDVLARARTLEG